jgi:uncharacterized protein (DUF58 family)
MAEDLLAGDFSSVFKGQGIEFDEIRHYEAGDDVRSIDWNASARFGRPYVKMYREEREFTVFIVLDASASMFARGGAALSRYEQGLLAAALVAFSAERASQRVGALFFGRDIDRIYPPRKGRRHIMGILGGGLQKKTGGRGSGLGKAMIGAGRLLKQRSLLILISDFLCVNWEQELGHLCRDHDVIALRISDPLDMEFAAPGLVSVEDPETGVRIQAPGSFGSFRAVWREWHEERARLWEALCRRSGAAYLELSTAEEAAEVLPRFFVPRRGAAGLKRGRT